nr:hypothetical protein [Mycobacterium marinum]
MPIVHGGILGDVGEVEVDGRHASSATGVVWAGAAAFAVLSADPTPAESAAADPSTSGIAITNDM